MTHASLFSGIGGFDLAAEWAGWTNMFNCEIDGFCRKVLKYHFPNAQQYADIRTTDFTVWRGRIDVLTGGFPCQPFSLAGKRRGTEDDRYLWPEMLRAIREIRPEWVVGENVYGFVNWSNGLVFDTMCADLENAGYQVGAFILPAAAVGAPHRRDRVWVVAHRSDAGSEAMRERQDGVFSGNHAADSDGNRRRKRTHESKPVPECVGTSDAGNGCENRTPADPDNDATNASLPASLSTRKSGIAKVAMQSGEYRAGAGFRLNPRYVAEMMGFPPNWTESPFRHGAGNLSKHSEMP